MLRNLGRVFLIFIASVSLSGFAHGGIKFETLAGLPDDDEGLEDGPLKPASPDLTTIRLFSSAREGSYSTVAYRYSDRTSLALRVFVHNGDSRNTSVPVTIIDRNGNRFSEYDLDIEEAGLLVGFVSGARWNCPVDLFVSLNTKKIEAVRSYCAPLSFL